MNNIIFKGVSSTTLDGLLICELPPISKPAMRTRQTAIDGRDGAVIEELGYSSYNKSIVVGLYGQYDINKIIKYFSGEGELVFSNEPDKVYKATIVDKIDFERLVRYRKAKVTFLVQPFKYKKDEPMTETETATASGTEMSFESGKANVHALNIYGKTTQSGTPTQDAPIPLENVSGANLFNKNEIVSGQGLGSGGASYADATYCYSEAISVKEGIAYSAQNVSWCNFYTDNKTPTTSNFVSQNTEKSLIAPSGAKYVRLCVSLSKIDIAMLNEGTTAIAYRPYTNGQECVLTNVEGGNLLDMASFGGTNIDAVTNVDGSVTLTSKVNGASTTSAHLTGKLPAGTYTLKVISGGTLYWQTNATDYSNGVAIGNNKTFTYDGTSYLRILLTDFSAKESRVYTVMLNKGSKPLPFQPYTAPQQLITTAPNGLCGVPVSSGGNYTDANGQQWMCDEIDFERGVLIKRTHTITFKGTEGISPLGGTGDSNAFFYAMDANVLSTRPHTIDNEGYSLCSHFKPDKIATSTTCVGHQVRRVSTGTQYRILFRPEGVANMSALDFQNWLKANNPTVTYALETPNEITLSAEDIAEFKALQTSKGTTTISIEDDGEMTVEYFKPFEVFNEGLEPSRPLMLLKGSGTVEVSVNGIGTFSYTFPEGENEVYIDSEKEDAYLGAVLKNRNMNGEFPILQPNKNTIEWSGYVESIKILPRSRWL
jgi:predicted phage tail component-like protein